MIRSSLIVVVALVFACPSQARTWRVERDGTGDFQVIQDAVDVAASGDTIRIGIGRFDEAEEILTPGWTKLTRVVLKQDTLTMIGAGDGQTIIGREEPFQLEAHGYDLGLGENIHTVLGSQHWICPQLSSHQRFVVCARQIDDLPEFP